MTKTENTAVNSLFIDLEEEENWCAHLNRQSLYAAENQDAYSTVMGESMIKLAQIQKRLVRLFLRSGEIGELLSHIEVGTFPPRAIAAALNRLR